MSDNSNSKSIAVVLPILFGFFVMGFVDVVGISVSYVQQSFALSDTMAFLLPVAVFLWFFVFSIPTALLMTKIGRKNTVLLSMVVTAVAMSLPLISYTYPMCVAAFCMIGIGNTIIQVSMNPLLMNVVPKERLTSWMTFGQFVKAISSFVGPFIAAFAAERLGGFKWMFAIYAGTSILAMLWLLVTPVPKSEAEKEEAKVASFGGSLSLLTDPYILVLFLGILFVVAVDVGMNTVSPKFLMEKLALIDPIYTSENALSRAGKGTQFYFIGRTIGAFLGAFILARVASATVFRISMIAALGSLAVMFYAPSVAAKMSINTEYVIWAAIAAIGFFCANIFSIIFSAAIRHKPERADEISGLMIMGVAGGSFALGMGILSDKLGSQTGSIIVLGVCMLYLLFASFFVGSEKKQAA